MLLLSVFICGLYIFGIRVNYYDRNVWLMLIGLSVLRFKFNCVGF